MCAREHNPHTNPLAVPSLGCPLCSIFSILSGGVKARMVLVGGLRLEADGGSIGPLQLNNVGGLYGDAANVNGEAVLIKASNWGQV